MEYPEMFAFAVDHRSDLYFFFLFHIAPYAANGAKGALQ